MAFSLESSFMSRKILFPINRISDPSLINYVIFCSFLFTFLKPGKYSLIRPYICYYLPYLTVVWFLASRCFTSRPRRPINAAPFCRSCGSWKVSAAIVVPVRHLRPIQIGSDHVDFLGRIFSPPPLIPLDEKSTYPIVFYKVGDDFADSIAAVVNGQLRQLPAILQREGAAGEGMLSWSHPLCWLTDAALTFNMPDGGEIRDGAISRARCARWTIW